MKATKLKILILAVLALAVSGCTLLPTANTSKVAPADGGVWRSVDAGGTFTQAGDVLATKGKVSTLNNLSILKLVFDPSDANTIYALTTAYGLVYTLDGGNSWSQFKALNQGAVSGVAVSSANKCLIDVLAGNKLYQTVNCGRDFTNIYYHQKAIVNLTAIALDPKTPNIVYLGTSEGEILKSTDGGQAWVTVMREANNSIMDIIIDNVDQQVVYVGTSKSGIFKSIDAGKTWNNLGAGLASYVGSHEYKRLIADPATPNGLIFISKFGLLHTSDGGSTWQVVELLPDAKKLAITAVGVNPKNSLEFYYTTATTLVKTTDGGQKWSSKKLPFSTRTANGIFVSPANPNIVFLSTELIKK